MVRIILTLLVLIWGVYSLHPTVSDGLLHIIFCDVGQGDATIIRLNSVQVLIDGGRDDSVLRCLQESLPPWDKHLEIVIATHPDADHINGLVSVLENYTAGVLLHNGQVKETADFNRFKSAVQNQVEQGAVQVTAKSGMTIHIEEYLDLSVIYPHSSSTPGGALSDQQAETILSDVEASNAADVLNYNDASIVLKLRYGLLDVLLMGDLEEAGERALIDGGLIAEVEVLKVGHHGSKTSSTSEFIGITRPEISVISAGKNNAYGHPHPLVIERLTQVGSQILRTDQDSTIELVSNGMIVLRRPRHVWFKKR
ncbi:MAG: competence protein ComEC, partial [Patescibacteria group bacterium]|nr:competence protein ComEC [Patescibacteria group bacterium]